MNKNATSCNNDCLSLDQLAPATPWHGLLLKSEACGRRCRKRAAHKSDRDCCLAVVVGSFLSRSCAFLHMDAAHRIYTSSAVLLIDFSLFCNIFRLGARLALITVFSLSLSFSSLGSQTEISRGNGCCYTITRCARIIKGAAFKCTIRQLRAWEV